MKPTLTMLTILAAGLLGACGQKGPLYLPDNPSQITVNEPASAERDEDDEEDQDAGENARDRR